MISWVNIMKKSIRLLTHAFLEKVRVPSAPPQVFLRPNVVPIEEKKFTFFGCISYHLLWNHSYICCNRREILRWFIFVFAVSPFIEGRIIHSFVPSAVQLVICLLTLGFFIFIQLINIVILFTSQNNHGLLHKGFLAYHYRCVPILRSFWLSN